MATITSGYGTRPAPAPGASTNHEGIDYRAPVGSPVYANKPLTVTYAGKANGYGNVVYAKDASGVEYRFGHLDSIPSNVKPGATIQPGEKIANTGNTGVSSGAHLHYETRKNGKPFDPTKTVDPATGKTYDNNASFDPAGGSLGNTTPKPDKGQAPGGQGPSRSLPGRPPAEPGPANPSRPRSSGKKSKAVNTVLYINPLLRLGDE
jgi:hypothetical protein